MKKIKINQLIELVKKRIGVFIDGPHGQWTFQTSYAIKTSGNKEQFELDEIIIIPKKNPVIFPDDVIKTFHSVDDIILFLTTEKYIIKGFLTAHKSFDELIEEALFEHISMKELLIKYHECDTFSLTCPYNDGYNDQHPHGIYSITQQQADEIWSQINDEHLKNLYTYYEMMPKRFKSKHSFENLLEETKNESLALYDKVMNNQLEADGSPYACDMFASGKAKYKSPKLLWHFYHAQDIVYEQRNTINNILKNAEHRDITFALEEPYYHPLKNSYLKSVIGFSWHCTTSRELSITYYFKMDEQTKAWLSELQDDYDMKTLEDLAFYYKGHLAFSSCTHEGFHHDYLEQAKIDAKNEISYRI